MRRLLQRRKLSGAERIGDPLLRIIAQLNLAKSLKKNDPKRAEKILRAAVAGARDAHGLGHASLITT